MINSDIESKLSDIESKLSDIESTNNNRNIKGNVDIGLTILSIVVPIIFGIVPIKFDSDKPHISLVAFVVKQDNIEAELCSDKLWDNSLKDRSCYTVYIAVVNHGRGSAHNIKFQDPSDANPKSSFLEFRPLLGKPLKTVDFLINGIAYLKPRGHKLAKVTCVDGMYVSYFIGSEKFNQTTIHVTYEDQKGKNVSGTCDLDFKESEVPSIF